MFACLFSRVSADTVSASARLHRYIGKQVWLHAKNACSSTKDTFRHTRQVNTYASSHELGKISHSTASCLHKYVCTRRRMRMNITTHACTVEYSMCNYMKNVHECAQPDLVASIHPRGSVSAIYHHLHCAYHTTLQHKYVLDLCVRRHSETFSLCHCVL